MLHADPGRSYSWLWDTHINPKNSKWLQENLTDMDAKVKAMTKIIEEDADSFARRAEMYYKKRPELMKLVEEFYRAYRLLAARYDNATGELRQAHRAMAEAFPDQIPFSMSEDSPRASSVSDSEPNTSEVASLVRSLLDLDDLQKDSSVSSSLSSIVKKSGLYSEENDAVTSKKGLKQLSEMFLANSDKKSPESGGGVGIGKYADGKSRRRLTFPESEEKSFELESHTGASVHRKNEVSVQDMGTQYEAPCPETEENESKDGMHLVGIGVTQNCKISTESEERLSKAEAEVHDLQVALSKLRQEYEAVTVCSKKYLEQYQNSLQKISNLETEVSGTHEEMKRLNEDIESGTLRFKTAEEKVSLLDRSNKCLQLEVDSLEKKLILQEERLRKEHCEIEQLRLQMQEEHLIHEADLQSTRQLNLQLEEQHGNLVLELQKATHLFKDMEHRNQVSEEEIVRLKEEINSLNITNLKCTETIKSLQDALCTLNETKRKLEEEVGHHVHQKNALWQELSCLKQESHDLGKRYNGLMSQIESVGLDSECLQSSVKNLQDEIILLKESCNKKDEENIIICERLKNMEKVLEEKSLLENLLSDKNNDLNIMREKLKVLEESFDSLTEEKSELVKEKDSLSAKVDNMMQDLQIKEALNAAAEEKCLYLEKENESVVNQVKELWTCLQLEKEERESILQSSRSQLDGMEIKINALQDENEQGKAKLEAKEDCIFRARIETTVIQCVMLDMCKTSQNIFLECQKYLEMLSNTSQLISEFKQRNLEQEMQLESIFDKHSLTVEHNLKLKSGIEKLARLLHVDQDHSDPDKVGTEIFFQKLQNRVEAINTLLATTQTENAHMFLESTIIATLLAQLGLELSDLFMMKKALDMEAAAQAEELMVLQSRTHELEKVSELLRQKVLSMEDKENVLEADIRLASRQLSESEELNRSLENQNRKLYEENISLTEGILYLKGRQSMLEEENIAVLHEAFSTGNLALIFECFNGEKEIEIHRLNEALDCIKQTNCTLREEMGVITEKLRALEMENSHLRELVEKLEEYKSCSLSLESEVDKFRNACGELKEQIELGQKLLNEKEFKLSNAEHKLEKMQIEKAEIMRELELVKKKHDEATIMKSSLEKDMMELTIDNANKSKKNDQMHEEKKLLMLELDRLHKKSDDLKLQEEHLKIQLKENMDEIELLHTCCATLYYDLQVSVIHAAVLEQKVYELIDACKGIEEHSQTQAKRFLVENASKNTEIHQLKGINAFLGEENEKMKLESIGYFSLISSLKESIIRLEDRCFVLMGVQQCIPEDDESNHGNFTSEVHAWSENNGGEKQDGLQELHKLQAKIEVIDVTMGGFENMKKEYDEVKLIKEALEDELNILAEEIVMKSKEMKCIHEDKAKLEMESYELLEELDQCQLREEYFKCELEAKAEEIELWLTSSEMLYHDLESCSIHEMLIKQKWLELMEACESLDVKSRHETKKLLDNIAARNVEVDELQKKIVKLEELNEEMSERSDRNMSLVSSVKESLCSLEDRCLAALGARTSGTHKGAGVHDRQDITSLVPESALKCAGTEKVVLELQELLVKFRTVERLVIELSQLSHFVKDKNTGARVSGSFGKGRKEDKEADEQMLELWETAERQSSHGTENLLSVKGGSRDVDCGKIMSTKKAQINQEPELSELQVEREVAVDKIEVSCQSEKNKRIREMLTSESHRLMDLQNNAQELNKRFEKLKTSSHADGFEFDNAMEQLRGTELAILLLVELNHKLLKDSQSSSVVSSEKETGKSEPLTGRTEDLPDIDRSHVQEARKRSEKIEQLEIELQKMEFILRKLEDGHVKRMHAVVEKRARVLLRDYLYGGRGKRKQKKVPFCGCMRLLTKDD
ncbi:unnamed protein product [Victoria cruziana]